MAVQNQEIKSKGESVLININQISQSVGHEDIQALTKVINDEIGSYKLNKEDKEQLQAIMSVDALEASKWKSVADVLKYISIFAIAENNPEAFKKITNVLLSIVCIKFPAVIVAQGLLTKVPDQLFSVLIKIGGFASPDYLLYQGINKIATIKAEKAKAQAEDEAKIDGNMTTLIIVCKNKLLSAEMNKLIKAEDDIDKETIIGTKDGTVHTIIWNEAAWEAFRDKLSSNDRVVIIGKIKGTMPLSSEQIQFEKYGVKYGWNNNIAIIDAEPKYLNKSKTYKEFLAVLDDLQISEKMKKNAKLKFDWVTAGKLAIFPPLLIGDILYEDTAVKKQQLMYGLYSFYMQDLDRFLNAKELECK